MSPVGKLPGSNPDSTTRADFGSCPQLPHLRSREQAWLAEVLGPCALGLRPGRERGRRLLQNKRDVRAPGGALRSVRRAGCVSPPASPAAWFQTDSVDHTWIAQHRSGRGREGALPWRRPRASWRPCVLVPSIRGAATLAQTLVEVCSPC